MPTCIHSEQIQIIYTPVTKQMYTQKQYGILFSEIAKNLYLIILYIFQSRFLNKFTWKRWVSVSSLKLGAKLTRAVALCELTAFLKEKTQP